MTAEGGQERVKGELSELEEGVILAAIDLVESETAPPLVGVPSRDQPWTQARARLATAVEAYRNAETVAKKERDDR